MHELSVCQALLGEASRIAAGHAATRILSITVRIGPLSGIDAGLLMRAFDVARLGTMADGAELKMEKSPIRVTCRTCGATGAAELGQLLCGFCGDYQVNLIAGDELLLAALELDTKEECDV